MKTTRFDTPGGAEESSPERQVVEENWRMLGGASRGQTPSFGRGKSLEQVVEEKRLQTEKKYRPPSILAHIGSGVIGSLIAELTLFPLDTVKILVQTSKNHSGNLETVLRILREKGVLGFYQGIGGALFKECFHSANFWLWHGLVFRHLATAGDTSASGEWNRLLLHMFTKNLNWLCTSPFEVISSNNQLSGAGFFNTARKLYEQGGLGFFYRGLGYSLSLTINPAIMHNVIARMLKLFRFVRVSMGMDPLKAIEHGPLTMFWATAIGKVVATLLTYPVIRAKVLAQTTYPQYSAVWQFPMVCREIIKNDGYRGFFQGVVSMSYKTVLHNALMLSLKNFIQPRQQTAPPTPLGFHVSDLHKLVPSAYREPFTLGQVTAEKLDELLTHVRSVSALHRIENLESSISDMKGDLNEIKHLLLQSRRADPNDPGQARSQLEV